MTKTKVPYGYIKTQQTLSVDEVKRIKETWTKAIENRETVVLGAGCDFIPFDRNITLSAICLYCTRPNLSSSLWCEGCGAPMCEE